jgi:ubiquinone biosynthesis protein COQ9
MMEIERSAERDAAIEAMLPNVPFDGWTLRALRHGGVEDGDLLFPGGTSDLIEAWCDLADRWMERGAAELGLEEMRLTGRIRALVALRLRQARPHKDAVRRAMGWMALPGHGRLAARCTARSVDAIWHAAGDRSADASWYSKRAILAGIYGGTLLVWVRDPSEDDAGALAFLDRRLAGLGHFGRLKGRVQRRIKDVARHMPL